MRRPPPVVVVVLVAICALLAVGPTHGVGASGAEAPVGRAVVGPGVAAAVARAESTSRAAGAGSRSGGPVVVASLRDPLTRSASLQALEASTRAVQSDVLAHLPDDGVEVLSDFRAVPSLVVRLSSTDALDALAAHPRVDRLDLGVAGRGDLAAAGPLVGAPATHAEGIRGQGTRVAVLDSGIDTDHPDLAGDLVRQECFGFDLDSPGFCPNGTDRQSGPGAAEDDAGHGTHVSGIVGSDGVVSARGVAPDAEIVAIKILQGGPCGFSGCFDDFTLSVVAALDWIITHPAVGIDVVNASVGTRHHLFAGDCDGATAWTQAGAAAVNALRARGVLVVASAGNNGSTSQMTAPACLRNVVSVGASTLGDGSAAFTNASTTTDVFAPGVGIVSDAVGGGTTNASGTSMAAPMVAGCAALLVTTRAWDTAAELEARLESSPVTVTAAGRPYPRLDCRLEACVDGIVDVLADHDFCEDIAWLAEQGITGGFADGTFRPTAPVTRGSMAAFLHRMAGSPPWPRPTSAPFPDVPTTHAFAAEIEWLASQQITGGFPDGTYRPASPVGRGSMAAFLYRAAGEPAFTPPLPPSFDDVPSGHAFFTEVEWLADEGIASGFPDDLYRPALAVSRQAMAAFLHRADAAALPELT